MSLIQGIINIFREQHDRAAEAIADPVRDAKYDIEDAKRQIADFESKIATLMATNLGTQRKADESDRESQKWAGIAASAAKAGNREDVTQAVSKQRDAERQRDTYKSEVEQNGKIIESLRAQLNGNRTKIARAEANRAQLAARLDGAKIRKELMGASKMVDGGPLSRLDKLQETVDAAENEASAYEILSSSGDEQLADKYAATDSDVADEVERLMASSTK